MSWKMNQKIIKASLFIILFLASIIYYKPIHAAGPPMSGHSQGATITKDYFIYTDYTSNNSATKIYRCKRSGTSVSNCKKLFSANLQHANALEHHWGTDYFWVFGGDCNPKSGDCRKKGREWCYNLDGKRQSDTSKCGARPQNNSKEGYGTPQGYTQYGKYILKGYSGSNKIVVYNGKNDKSPKVLNVGHGGEELEDVMVDGDTGSIFFTTSGWGSIKLYKYKGYTLPKSANASSSESSESRSSKAPSKSESTKTYTFTPAESKYDNTVETAFFGKIKDTDGCGVYTTINFVLDLLFVGVGIVAVIGISFAGVKYLTAHGNIDQTRVARRRIFQIIIGVTIYAVIYSLANWLLVDADFSGESCKTASHTIRDGTAHHS